jgi:UDP-4-amino-4,6-dideoxy-N-acetyl-beta-L-altrosamine transaminase
MIKKNIPYGRQDISDEDISAVVNSLKSDFLTQGPKINEFETRFAEYVGSDYAIAVSNGTAALHLACLALDLSEGSKVITTPITFVASANCVKYCDADVVFSDIDPETYLINIDRIKVLLSESPRGTYSGIIPVNFAGRVVNLELLRNIANEYGLWILEDACHSPGGFFIDSKGEVQSSGSSKYSDLSIFSFHPVKHIACGEGGMITTNNKILYEKILSLRTHGITKDPLKMIQNDGGWYYEMHDLGFNYRLTDFQASLGLSQLNRADFGIHRRREIAKKYYKAFENKSYILSQSGIVEGHAYHLYIILVENRDRLYNFLKARGIYCQVHYIPINTMPYYKQNLVVMSDTSNANWYYSKCISLPMFPTLKDDEQEFVIKSIYEFHEK